MIVKNALRFVTLFTFHCLLIVLYLMLSVSPADIHFAGREGIMFSVCNDGCSVLQYVLYICHFYVTRINSIVPTEKITYWVSGVRMPAEA